MHHLSHSDPVLGLARLLRSAITQSRLLRPTGTLPPFSQPTGTLSCILHSGRTLLRLHRPTGTLSRLLRPTVLWLEAPSNTLTVNSVRHKTTTHMFFSESWFVCFVLPEFMDMNSRTFNCTCNLNLTSLLFKLCFRLSKRFFSDTHYSIASGVSFY